MKLRYEKETQTVRTVPENYCAASASNFSDGGQMDAAIINREELMRLFAAAPEMLRALDEFLECGPNVGHNLEFIEQVKNLIKKTKGG